MADICCKACWTKLPVWQKRSADKRWNWHRSTARAPSGKNLMEFDEQLIRRSESEGETWLGCRGAVDHGAGDAHVPAPGRAAIRPARWRNVKSLFNSALTITGASTAGRRSKVALRLVREMFFLKSIQMVEGSV
jgi:hypothetical protein